MYEEAFTSSHVSTNRTSDEITTSRNIIVSKAYKRYVNT